MQRICSSLSKNGYKVVLVGVLRKSSAPLTQQIFSQKRIKIFFEKSVLFYAEYNLKLFFYLLFSSFDVVCSIDLDTIIAGYFSSVCKRKKRVYDAHEIFTQMKEVITRKHIFKFWMSVEKIFVPKFKFGYTVNYFIQQEFKKRYNSDYEIIKNIAKINNEVLIDKKYLNKNKKSLIYQGAVNHGRAFEQLIPAMALVENINLEIYGKGNFFNETKALITKYNLEEKVFLKGSYLPEDLKKITPKCWCGITIFDAEGYNQYYSLANRFFDYMMAGIPQICVNYPEYKVINDEFNFALMIDNTEPKTIAKAIKELLDNDYLYHNLKENAINAREKLNWENEEHKLIQYWKKIIND